MEKNIIKLNPKQLERLIKNMQPTNNEEVESANYDKEAKEFIITSLFDADSRREYKIRLNDKIINTVFSEEKVR